MCRQRGIPRSTEEAEKFFQSPTPEMEAQEKRWSLSPTQRFYRKEGNVLFNDALNTIYLRLYGVGHMVKDHSDRKRGNPLPPLNGLLFPISSKGTYHGLCYTSSGPLAGLRNSSVDQSDNPLHHELLPQSYISLLDNFIDIFGWIDSIPH